LRASGIQGTAWTDRRPGSSRRHYRVKALR
jgi:hypothetical protein